MEDKKREVNKFIVPLMDTLIKTFSMDHDNGFGDVMVRDTVKKGRMTYFTVSHEEGNQVTV